ncbi:MAG TPA: hypothetical protein DD666_22205 [Advenella kashmirensis]|uniref:Conjugal transfer protein TrbC n=1 Tax=Advenella kashmirensis TaxID=310575 RepID=A0A356LML7_9BURK|nr:hypothetical protein [Advenella kashmirensis]
MTHVSIHAVGKARVRRMASYAFTLALLLASPLAVAQGFASEINSMGENIRDGIYIFVGTMCGITVLWCIFEGAGGRKTWLDLLHIGLWVFAAGAAIVVTTWIFSQGGSISV